MLTEALLQLLHESVGGFLYLFLRVDGADSAHGSFPPPLPAAEERALFAKMRSGDEKARETLICHNLRLVAHMVRKYYGNAPEKEDLVSIGTIGLIKAIDTFNAENGARFATYAGKCVQNEILMHFRAEKKLACEVSVNDTIDTDKDGNALTYLDVIQSDTDIAEEIGRRMDSADARRLIRSALSERERLILSMRYGLDGELPRAQREVAQALGISRSYVSRIEKGALDKIREQMGAD